MRQAEGPGWTGAFSLAPRRQVDDCATVRLELTRKTDLALRALQLLALADETMKGEELAGSLETTAGFLVQVMAPLTREGWVRSIPGPRGGYEATDAVQDASVLRLVEAVEGPVRADRCVLRDQPCPAQIPCALHDAWVPARDALVYRLAATPLLAPIEQEQPER